MEEGSGYAFLVRLVPGKAVVQNISGGMIKMECEVLTEVPLPVRRRKVSQMKNDDDRRSDTMM